MSWIVIIYMLGVILTVSLYRRWCQDTIPVFEIALGWWFQLPTIIDIHVKHKKTEQLLIAKRTEIWSQLFNEALKQSHSENWSDSDWKRWTENVEYSLNLVR